MTLCVGTLCPYHSKTLSSFIYEETISLSTLSGRAVSMYTLVYNFLSAGIWVYQNHFSSRYLTEPPPPRPPRAGVFREPPVPRGRSEDLPYAGDPRHRPLRTLEDGTVSELPAQRAGRPRGSSAGPGAALDPGLSRTEGYPHATGLVS